MKVKNLIAELQKRDPELEVLLSIDGEGNGFNPVHDVEDVVYDTSGWLDPKPLSWSADDASMEDDEWESYKKRNPHAVLIWP